MRFTGHVCFFDRNGKTLLDEVGGGKGKEFKPYTVPNREIGADSRITDEQRHGWTWTATFESPDDGLSSASVSIRAKNST